MGVVESDMGKVSGPAKRAVSASAASEEAAFTEFVTDVGPRLRQALVASLGGEVGRESAAEALAYGWEHWARLRGMANPAGYLYRVGRSRGIGMFRRRRREVSLPGPPSSSGVPPPFEPGLPAALERLSERQRTVVMLVDGYGLTHREVAEVLQISVGTVQRHLERGLASLRKTLKVETDV